tara:strand:+ start:171 stop:779 length:609 start_codon:yes stop_codon:yes gene_type:complete
MDRVISIIAVYEHTLGDVLRLRLINKKCRDNIFRDLFLVNLSKLLFSRRTFIPVGRCWACDTTAGRIEQTLWVMDEPPRRTMVVCDNWKCRRDAFCSKLYELFYFDHFIYFYPALEDKEYNIPRTDPTKKTTGRIVNGYHDGAILRNGQFYIYVQWSFGDHNYRKIVPFQIFIEYNNLNQSFSIRQIYNINKSLTVANESFP